MVTLIKNGLVVNGSGEAPVQTDILVSHGSITRVGPVSTRHADRIIDASGAIVTPGFIDVNTSSDHYLSVFSEPAQEDFIRQGVTTIIGGNCGASLAPLVGGSLDVMSEWGSSVLVNINWSTLRELRELLRRRGIGVNFGTMVGLSTLRRCILGENARDLTDSELVLEERYLLAAFKDGAFGFSSGLGYSRGTGTPYREIARLAKLAADHRRVYATHLRNTEERLHDAIEETAAIAEETHVTLEVSHFVPLIGYATAYREALARIERTTSKANIHFDVYPFDSIAMPLTSFLPPWLRRGTQGELMAALVEPSHEAELVAHFRRYTVETMSVGRVFDSSLKFLEGKSIDAFAGTRSIPPARGLLELMRLTKLRAVMFWSAIDREVLAEFLVHPNALIASNAAALGAAEFKHNRSTTTASAFLGHIKETQALTLEQAVKKLTSVPAETYRIAKRGRILEGYAADLVVLRENVPTDVLVNGVVALERGVPTRSLSGSVIAPKTT